MTHASSRTSRRSEGVPISDVSRVLGIPMPTLRSWESRYGIPQTPRNPGTHRRYTSEDLRSLRLMRDEIARGASARAAAAAVHRMLAPTGQPDAFVADLLAASEASDAFGLREHLDRAQAALGMARSMDEVVLPALAQIGAWWATGRCDVALENMTSGVVRVWLRTLTATAPPSTHQQPILLACGPEDRHTIGLEAFGVLLRHSGHECRLLGPRDAAAMRLAVDATRPEAVVIVAHLASGRRQAVEAIRAAAAGGGGTPVFYAGNAFAGLRSRRSMPGTYLGTTLAAATDTVVATLGAIT